jgi:hypothetical protein
MTANAVFEHATVSSVLVQNPRLHKKPSVVVRFYAKPGRRKWL